MAFGIWFLINRENIHEFTDTYKNREQAQLNIAQTRQRIAQLKRQQQSLAYNGVETEKQIRERLQMHKLGEQVVFFTKEETTSTTTTVDTGSTGTH
jgi:cell division protein FtsB